MYVILSFIGKKPMIGSTYSKYEYRFRSKAISLARIQHFVQFCKTKNDNIYTIVIDKDNDEVVEWITYKKMETDDKVEATKLAEELYQE
jgi:uncharacterized protein YfdQ (DUF2303 family)